MYMDLLTSPLLFIKIKYKHNDFDVEMIKKDERRRWERLTRKEFRRRTMFHSCLRCFGVLAGEPSVAIPMIHCIHNRLFVFPFFSVDHRSRASGRTENDTVWALRRAVDGSTEASGRRDSRVAMVCGRAARRQQSTREHGRTACRTATAQRRTPTEVRLRAAGALNLNLTNSLWCHLSRHKSFYCLKSDTV